MLIAAFVALSAAAAVLPPAKPGDIKALCRNPGLVVADVTDKSAGIHPLASEPPARQIKAVVREIDGCNTPIVVSAQVGTPKRSR